MTKKKLFVYDYTYLLHRMVADLKKMEEFHRSDKAMALHNLDTADEIHKAIEYLEEILHGDFNSVSEHQLIQEAFAFIGQYLTGWWD